MKDAAIELVPRSEEARSEVLPPDLPVYHVGEWYWHNESAEPEEDGDEDSDDEPTDEPVAAKEPSLVCVIHVGSNYVKVKDVTGASWRVHVRDVDTALRPAPEADRIIAANVAAAEDRMRVLTEEARALAMRLGVGPSLALSEGAPGENALATLANTPDPEVYKTALVTAKEETLPAIFEKIERAAGSAVTWARFRHAPLAAQAEGLKLTLGRIDDQLLNVELYAGLGEQLVQVRDGAPAAMTDKLHLLQRRCYMDEECLAFYKAGGMRFRKLDEFDRWLCRREHLNRLLPFPRSIVAFRIRRRNVPPPELATFVEFMHWQEEAKADLKTFLYIRNGEQVFRMSTLIDFGERLFPDLTSETTSRELRWSRSGGGFMTENDYQQRLADHERALREWKKARKEYDAYEKRRDVANKRGEQFTEPKPRWVSHFGPDWPGELEKFTPDSVYYDDMRSEIARRFREHNRIALIVQGLLDRSLALHPHPPWQIHTDAGFNQAIELVYDEARALTPGEAPDFEAYRAELNASLAAGSITVGQRAVWEGEQTERDRERRRWRDRGPLKLHTVESIGRGGKTAKFSWQRDGQGSHNWDKKYRVAFRCSTSELLNVSAYKRGDFKRFFADPRTRRDYLRWAPFLLAAEDYHGGKEKDVGGIAPKAQKRTGPPSLKSLRAARRRKLRAQYHFAVVRLSSDVELKNGKTMPRGAVFRVRYAQGHFHFHEVSEKHEDVAGGLHFYSDTVDDVELVTPPSKEAPGDDE